MKNTPFIHLGIAVFVFLLLIGASVWASFQISGMTTRADTLANEIASKRVEAGRVAAAKSTLPKLAEDESSVRKYFVPADDIVPFLERLQNAGKPFGAKVEVVSVDSDPGSVLKKINLSLKITGSFDSVMRTIGTIEYGPYDASLTNVTIDTVNTANKTSEWTAGALFALGAQVTATSTSK